MPARKPKTDEKPQFERFLEAVKQSGAEETDEAFERAIKKIAPPRRPARVSNKTPRT